MVFMKNDSLESNINHRMAVISSLAKRLIQRTIRSAGLGITSDQWFILTHLWHKDGLSIGEISEHTQKEISNITRIVEKLERDGYVEKRRDEADKRSWRVFLLPKADTIKNTVRQLQHQTMHGSLEGISEQQQQTLLKLLDRMEKNVVSQIERLQNNQL